VEGVMLDIAKHIHLVAAKDPQEMPPDSNPSTILINAAGKGINDGEVLVNATTNVTATAGAAFLGLVSKGPANGEVTVQCGQQGKITFCRMPEATQPQMIQLTPAGIVIDGGTAPAPTPITLKCGPNKITIDPQGVTIDAVQITLKAKAKIDEKALMKKK